jgi:hypothetical protein
MSAVLAAGFSALPARSATIVEVRVGQHPAFTRVVFELDEPSGYRVERRILADETGELVVTIEASSQGRSIRSSSPLLDVVSVEQSLGRAVARIRLREGNLALREMILTGPPRIVLDVMAPEIAVAVTATPAPTPEPITETPEDEPIAEAMAPEPEVVAEVIPEPELVVDLQPEPEPELGVDVIPEPERVVEVQPEPEPEIFAEPLPEDIVGAAEDAGEAELPEAEAIVEAPIEPATEMLEPPVAEPETEEVVARVPEPALPPADEGGGFELPFGITPLRAALAGLVLILAVAAVLLRRRSIPSDVDATTLGVDSGDEDSFMTEPRDAAENAALDDSPPQGSAQGVAVSAAPEDVGPFGGPEQGGSAMQSETQELPIERGGVDAPPKFGGDEESDLMQIVQEVQRRMAHLESRLDESNAARERLERQVASQSEELRVQRAAIARTQRALRGLTRTEDEATEPALRSPAKGANPGA